jgi:Ca2+-binding RTX toxin-like protein
LAIVGGVLAVPRAYAQPPTACLGYPVTDDRATDGDDYLSGTPEHDVIALGLGADQFFAWDGGDIVCGNDGADTLGGEFGDDTLQGGPGDDIVHGKQDDDQVFGGPGADRVQGGVGDDLIRDGFDGDPDELYDGPGADRIVGGVEDTWYKCQDGAADDALSFDGQVLPDPLCGDF